MKYAAYSINQDLVVKGKVEQTGLYLGGACGHQSKLSETEIQPRPMALNLSSYLISKPKFTLFKYQCNLELSSNHDTKSFILLRCGYI